MNIKDATREYREKCEFVKTFFDTVSADDATDTQRQEVKDANKRIEELSHIIQREQEMNEIKSANSGRLSDLSTAVNGLDTPLVPDGKGKAPQGTLGNQVLETSDFKAWRENIAKSGAVTRAPFGNSPNVSVKLLTGTSNTSAGALVTPDQLGIRDPGVFMRPLTVRDLITVGQTGSDSVEYVRVGTPTNSAAPVAEATATSNGSGAKPESDLPMSVQTASVKTIAHWVAATRRALADAGQLRTLIDAFLIYGLNEELEDQIIAGNGTGENFTGILETSGTQSQAFDTDLLTTTRKARTKVRVGGRANPTGYVMHPNDWQTFDLLQDNEARYFFGGPSVLGNPRLWGLPVIESEAMTAGTAVVADWRWAVLWDREQANIMMSDQHADFFVRNMIAILAELRAAFAILRPTAFVEISLS